MSWDNNRPRSRKYGWAHAKQRQAWAAKHQPTHLCGWCNQPLGPMNPTLHLAHDPTGQTVLGFWHRACNLQEAAQRARQRQTATPLTW